MTISTATATRRRVHAQLEIPLAEYRRTMEKDLLPTRDDRPFEDPPRYTPCPNPHLGDLASSKARAKAVRRVPESAIAAGKNTYVYDAHTYHTKVPPGGIEHLIEHFTRPGDVVLDPFCGSGMTGIAATNLGRRALISDLSPAATFIAYNFLTPANVTAYMTAVESVLGLVRDLESELYMTTCRRCGKDATLEYMVWSFGFMCSSCNREFCLWDVARDVRTSVRESKVKQSFSCPHCQVALEKRGLRRTKRYAVQVGYYCCGPQLQEQMEAPDHSDVALAEHVEAQGVPADLWYPKDDFPEGINTRQPIAVGITSVDKAYPSRALHAMAALWDIAQRWPDPVIRAKLLFTITSLYKRVTWFSEFRFWGGSGNTANLNVPAIANEQNVFRAFHRKAKTIALYFKSAPTQTSDFRVSTQSACRLDQIASSRVDYIFTDPPFGGNINYSEMNFLWESWLCTYTKTREEAIVNKVQGKDAPAYSELLAAAFRECRRVLKPGGWMTVVFHNSSAEVWEALRTALLRAGFAIAGTQTFDKKHGTFKHFVSDNAVGYDLVLHCKPARNLRPSPPSRGGTVEQVRDFVEGRLMRDAGAYVVRYEHVRRRPETDWRRLYAEWLQASLEDGTPAVAFAEFRRMGAGVVRDRRRAALLTRS